MGKFRYVNMISSNGLIYQYPSRLLHWHLSASEVTLKDMGKQNQNKKQQTVNCVIILGILYITKSGILACVLIKSYD